MRVAVPDSSTSSGPAVKATVGATLLMVTSNSAVLPASRSESVAWAVSVLSASPSAKMQSKVPESLSNEELSSTPLAPQLTAIESTSSAPGSVMLKV